MSKTPRVNAVLQLILESRGELSEYNCPEALVIEARKLEIERDALQARVKRLEEAGDTMKWWCCEPESVSQWNEAKESKQ